MDSEGDGTVRGETGLGDAGGDATVSGDAGRNDSDARPVDDVSFLDSGSDTTLSVDGAASSDVSAPRWTPAMHAHPT